jgi:hypothetical protein
VYVRVFCGGGVIEASNLRRGSFPEIETVGQFQKTENSRLRAGRRCNSSVLKKSRQ